MHRRPPSYSLSDNAKFVISKIFDGFVNIFSNTIEDKQNNFTIDLLQFLQTIMDLLWNCWITFHNWIRLEINSETFDYLKTSFFPLGLEMKIKGVRKENVERIVEQWTVDNDWVSVQKSSHKPMY